MRLLLLLLILNFSNIFATSYDDWGKTGHRVTGAIAANYLTESAKAKIAVLLEGQSLATVSTYGDEIKSDTLYRSFGPWHYVNIPFDKTYDTHPKNPKGDIIQGIEKCMTILKNPKSSREDQVFYLKLLVHFIGDLHQPLHTGLQEDKGGNDFQVRWFRDGSNLHRVWDTEMIEHYNMSYSELADNIIGEKDAQASLLQEGTAITWMEESRSIIKKLYQHTKVGDKLGYRYMYENFATVKNQLFKGGVRLAAILNELFS